VPSLTLEESLTAKLEDVFGPVLGSGLVYPDAAPEGDADAAGSGFVLYQRAGDEDRVYLDGGRCRARKAVYTLEVWHPDRSTLELARDAAFGAFAGANCVGRWGGSGGVWVQGATASDAAADVDPPEDASEQPLRGERITLTVLWTKES